MAVKKILFLVLTLIIAADALADPREIKVGVMGLLSGDFAAWGNAYLEGITLAQEAINSAGGVKGAKISLVIEDTRFDSKEVASATQKLISIEKVPVAMIATFTESMVAAPVFQRAKVPLLVYGDSGGEIEQFGKFIFSTGTWVKGYALSASQFLRARASKRVAIIATNNPWSQSNAATFKSYFEKDGGTIVYRADVNPSDSEFRTIVEKIKSLNVDGVFAPITANIVPFFKQTERLGKSLPIIVAAAALDIDVISAAPSAVEGRYVTNSYLNLDRPAAKNLSLAYQKKYGREMTYPSVVARGWDGFMAIAKASADATDISPDAIQQALSMVKLEGAGFRLEINEHGTAALPVEVLTVQDGKLLPAK